MKQRLEAFSDGVIAIAITIMALSIPLPQTLDASGTQDLYGDPTGLARRILGH